MNKPGPKPGRAAQIKADLEHYKKLTDSLHDKLLTELAHRFSLNQRITHFNYMPLWAKLWFILRGGHV